MFAEFSRVVLQFGDETPKTRTTLRASTRRAERKMNTANWTAVLVADRIREAAKTLKLLPNHHPGRRYRGAWPDILHDPNEAYGYSEFDPHPSAPSASAIDRMDEVILEWMKHLDSQDVKMVWSWALGIPARAVAAKLQIHRATVHRRRLAALKRLAVTLNTIGTTLRPAEDVE
jgi:hypothetical protein